MKYKSAYKKGGFFKWINICIHKLQSEVCDLVMCSNPDLGVATMRPNESFNGMVKRIPNVQGELILCGCSHTETLLDFRNLNNCSVWISD